jgi:hypothetical protein
MIAEPTVPEKFVRTSFKNFRAAPVQKFFSDLRLIGGMLTPEKNVCC